MWKSRITLLGESVPETAAVERTVCQRQVPSGPKEHLFWLDWVRFLAALGVVMCRARGGTWVAWGQLDPGDRNRFTAAFFALTRPGLEAVVVFFVLSGFLVGGKLLVRWRESTFDLRKYLIDRVSRIYTPFIPALLLTAGLSRFRGDNPNLLDFAGNLAGLQGWICEPFGGNSPLWSLSYEIWFYILAGCCVAIATSRNRFSAHLWVACAVGVCVFTKLSAAYLFVWVLGAVAFLSYERMTIKVPTAWFFVLTTFIGVILSQVLSDSDSVETGTYRGWLPSRDVAIIILGAGLAPLLAFVASKRPRRGLAIIERIGTRAAAFSYTLYLIHYPLLPLFERMIPGRFTTVGVPSVAWFISKVLFCLLAAWLFYLPFEARTTTVRRWMSGLLIRP